MLEFDAGNSLMPDMSDNTLAWLRDDMNNLRSQIRDVKADAKEQIKDALDEIAKKDAAIKELGARVAVLEKTEVIDKWLGGAKRYAIWFTLTALGTPAAVWLIKYLSGNKQ